MAPVQLEIEGNARAAGDQRGQQGGLHAHRVLLEDLVEGSEHAFECLVHEQVVPDVVSRTHVHAQLFVLADECLLSGDALDVVAVSYVVVVPAPVHQVSQCVIGPDQLQLYLVVHRHYQVLQLRKTQLVPVQLKRQLPLQVYRQLRQRHARLVLC